MPISGWLKRPIGSVTIVSDQQTGTVLHVGEDRRKETFGELVPEQLAGLESVSMDRWPAYINATLERVPGAREKIAFDKFHVAKCLGDAVNKVRRQEHRALMKQGCETLKGSRYDWLTKLDNISHLQKARFQALRHSTLKTARAWTLKELAMSQWHYVSRTWARKGWERWLSWAMRCRLEPVRQAAGTIRNHLWGILNAIVLKVTNGPAEGINSRIMMIKVRTSLPESELDAPGTVSAYKSLSQVERTFRSFKTVDLKVRPIFHYTPDRVRAQVLLCMLAYYVEWHMRQALAPLLFDDDDRAGAEAARTSVVAPAQVSPRAQDKARRKRTATGWPVHSFRTLLNDLATLARNRIAPRLPGAEPLNVLTRPTALQREAFRLLGVRLESTQ